MHSNIKKEIELNQRTAEELSELTKSSLEKTQVFCKKKVKKAQPKNQHSKRTSKKTTRDSAQGFSEG